MMSPFELGMGILRVNQVTRPIRIEWEYGNRVWNGFGDLLKSQIGYVVIILENTKTLSYK